MINVASLYLDLDDEAYTEYWLGRAANLRSDISIADDMSMIRLMYRGEQEQALELARQAFSNDADHPFSLWPLRLLRDHDLSEGQYERAKNRYASAFPELFSGEGTQVLPDNYQAAIDLYAVLIALDDRELADLLLDRCEALIQSIPRMGEWGYRIGDAQINAPSVMTPNSRPYSLNSNRIWRASVSSSLPVPPVNRWISTSCPEVCCCAKGQ